MTTNQTNIHFESRGIEFVIKTANELSALQASMQKHLEGLQLEQHVDFSCTNNNDTHQCIYKLKEDIRKQWAPAWDTTRLYSTMSIDGQKNTKDLDKEIVINSMDIQWQNIMIDFVKLLQPLNSHVE